jgi:hypothetical protein
MHTRTSKTASSETTAGKAPVTTGTNVGMEDQRPEADTIRQLKNQANHSPQALQLRSLQQLAARAGAVAQLTKKDDIKALGKGFNDADAENLKTIAGGWVAALALAKETTADFLRKVVATNHPSMIQRRILNQLSEAYYDQAVSFAANSGANFAGLMQKGMNNKLVQSMSGDPAPALQALVMAMSTNAAFTNIGRLGLISEHYPGFVPIISAQMAAAAAELQTVITWMGALTPRILAILQTAAPNFAGLQAMAAALTNVSSLHSVLGTYLNFRAVVQAQLVAAPVQLQTVIAYLSPQPANVLAWLETNNPTFAVLQVLAAEKPGAALLGMLVNFAKEVAPGDDDYEPIGAQNNEYRIGHYALGHTLRGMLPVPALNGLKTLWPEATTLAEVRAVCLDFDQNNATIANTKQSFSYTPTVAPTNRISARKNSADNNFDQLFPQNGGDISPADAATLGTINAVKNNWTAGP